MRTALLRIEPGKVADPEPSVEQSSASDTHTHTHEATCRVFLAIQTLAIISYKVSKLGLQHRTCSVLTENLVFRDVLLVNGQGLGA